LVDKQVLQTSETSISNQSPAVVLYATPHLAIHCRISFLQTSEGLKAKKEGRRYEYDGSMKGDNDGFYQWVIL